MDLLLRAPSECRSGHCIKHSVVLEGGTGKIMVTEVVKAPTKNNTLLVSLYVLPNAYY
jgi:hypothetical protein